MTDNIKLLYIDLFCGAGGTSTGVEKATFHGDKCAKVIACVNHDANAIASHAANHPDALHRLLGQRAAVGKLFASRIGMDIVRHASQDVSQRFTRRKCSRHEDGREDTPDAETRRTLCLPAESIRQARRQHLRPNDGKSIKPHSCLYDGLRLCRVRTGCRLFHKRL